MKLTAMALAIMATTASAEIYYDDDRNQVLIQGDRESLMSVRLSPSNGCEPIVVTVREVSGRAPTIDKDDGYQMTYKMRVDKRTEWDITGDLSRSDGMEATAFYANQKFINELRRGTTLRMKMPLHTGDQYYEGFSLMGFSVAYSKAKAACNPDESYFSRPSSSHETYL